MKQTLQKFKSVLAMLMCAIMIFTIMPTTAFAEDGDDYIEIRTIEELYNIRDNLSANYRLMNDIDLTEATAKGGDWDYLGNGWNPIGSKDIYGADVFTGNFDGNGHSIIGMRIEVTTLPSGYGSTLYLGLFASMNGEVKNLSFEGGNISNKITATSISYTRIGSICGATGSKSIITNCSSSLTQNHNMFTADSVYVGGLVGYSESASISKCYVTGELKMYTKSNKENSCCYVGGIAGYVTSAVSECYNAGYTNASCYNSYSYYSYYARTNIYVGGISGSSSKNVINCYNCGEIITSQSSLGSSYYYGGAKYVGGITGSGATSTCYNVGKINSAYAITASGSSTNSYLLAGTGSLSTGATSLTVGQMKLKSMYKGFDFENIWTIDEQCEYFYPQLKCNIMNKQIRAEKIEILKYPDNIVYKLNSKPDYESGLIEVTYVDGKTDLLDITNDMVSGVNTSVAGEQTATISYRGATASFSVLVTDGEMIGIIIKTEPTQKSYIEGSDFDNSGLEIVALFEDGTEQPIKGYAISGFNKTPGEKEITVSYNGFSTTFEVEVTAKSLTKIAITTKPSKKSYYEGQQLDVSDMVVTAYYDNGTEEVVINYALSGFESTPGLKTVTVEYKGKTATFTVQVKEETIDEISITQLPTKTSYIEGEELDLSGMIVTAYYKDGTNTTITDYEITGYDSTPGTKTICVKKGGASDSFVVTVSAIAHNFGEWTVTTPATCTVDGVETRTCTLCDHSETRVIKATGHTVVVDKAVAPTCTETGLTGGSHCSVCNTVFKAQAVVPALGHSYSEWTVTTASTCTEEGVETHTCSLCNHSETRAISATGHTVVVDNEVAPTCTETGLTEGSHCSVCNTVFKAQDVVLALGHSYGEWTATTAPTCAGSGVETHTCSRCDHSETRALTATGHTVVVDNAVEPTCTETGLTEGSHCSVCNAVITAQEDIPATGHTFGEWAVTTAPTCIDDGVETRTCTICSYSETRAVSATGHTVVVDNAVEPTCTETGLTEGSHCSACNTVIKAQDVIPSTGHAFGEWVVVSPSTTEKEGLEERTCHCGEKENRYIPKINSEVVSVKLNTKNVDTNYNRSFTLMPSVEVVGNSEYIVEYTSSNPKVAIVDSNGNVKTTGKGTATITVTVTDSLGNIVKDTCNVNVKFNFGQWLLYIICFGWIWM